MTKLFKCSHCGYVNENDAPEKCPKCHAIKDKFNEITSEFTKEIYVPHVFKCKICGYEQENNAPGMCPKCHAAKEEFLEITQEFAEKYYKKAN